LEAPVPERLTRELGVFGATMMGLGSIVGTGVFVSIGVAAGATGPSIVLAIALAAVVATCNALSSAQLAASHAVSGGTYEYGYRYLSPWLGFTAGWTFLCAKIASAATAALGLSGYLLRLLGVDLRWQVILALAAVVGFTLLVLGGVKRSNRFNIIIVTATLGSVSLFILFGLPDLAANGRANLAPIFPSADGDGLSGFFYATALMFVAYTGYGRVATLGEEVKNPRTAIPRAIVITLGVSAALYVLVAMVAIGAIGVERFAGAAESAATPLEAAARAFATPGLPEIVAVGAVTAMLGVLLNLILGLSRVVLAMGRQGDLPPLFGRLNRHGASPSAAVVGVGLAIAGLTVTASVETTWAFSAFTVLIYYAVTNLAALRLAREDRLYPRAFAVGGLAACLFLAFWVPLPIWLFGLGLILLGLMWHLLARRVWATRATSTSREP
jgi:APA family basic amino acid/polyamine antiporter